MVEVVEAYRDYTAPSGTRTTLQVLLETVRPELAAGLGHVVLTNAAALTGARKHERGFWRGKKIRHATQARGLYHQFWHGQPAWVELFVDQTFQGAPAWLLRLHLVRLALLGPVLYHELGHHIHKTSHPEYAERETVADDWSRRLFQEHVRARHPIARRLIALVWRLALAYERMTHRQPAFRS
jgi:hypothetical protein